ncbi:unnamed protein product, partial [Schistosoma curassoni]|uniref:Ovule protein n=1 Tax=Schistosoma curassoni TaxID=6186 RepID=A0A183KZT9_9TREM
SCATNTAISKTPEFIKASTSFASSSLYNTVGRSKCRQPSLFSFITEQNSVDNRPLLKLPKPFYFSTNSLTSSALFIKPFS